MTDPSGCYCFHGATELDDNGVPICEGGECICQQGQGDPADSDYTCVSIIMSWELKTGKDKTPGLDFSKILEVLIIKF